MFFITSKCAIIFIIVAACNSPPHYLAKPQGKDFADDSYYYGLCAPFQCGGINFTFPFSNSTIFGAGPRDCGLPRFQIICNVDSDKPYMELAGRLYRVNDFFPDPSERVISLVETDLISDLTSGSCRSLLNLTINMPTSLIANLNLPSWRLNYFTFFVCPQALSLSHQFLDAAVTNQSCAEGDDDLYFFADSTNSSRVEQTGVETPVGCRRVEVPISSAVSSASLWNLRNKTERWDVVLRLLGQGFPLTWSDIPTCTNCQNMGGRCGYDSGSVKTVCFLKDNQENKCKKRGLIIGIASGCSSAVAILVALSLLTFWKRIRLIILQKDQPTGLNNIDAESFIKTYQSTVVRSYSYKEIKKMTNSFQEKLGQGGYGSVYKGQLSDGRLVAVKILHDSNHEARDFINEVSTIGRIHHFNIIYLLGFCLEGSQQALIYEFMPNGSLGDMLRHEEGTQIGIEKMLEISIGIARGIQYLHIGCKSRILHLDIKPQNILIDNNLNPKISDFGLAKMYARNKSGVAFTTGVRGTIGYIAPEIFMRNIGNPSDRSDVYSFGMLLLEMVGKRKSGDGSSEAYFPDWVYEKFIEEEAEEVEEMEVSMLRKMVMVGLWCIQMNPRDRPSMTKVIQMLSGNAEVIERPPKPSFFSTTQGEMDTQNTMITSSNTDRDSTDLLSLPKVADC